MLVAFVTGLLTFRLAVAFHIRDALMAFGAVSLLALFVMILAARLLWLGCLFFAARVLCFSR